VEALLLTFDYFEWAEETKKLVRKYSVPNPSLDKTLDMIVFFATRGEFDNAETYRQLVENQLYTVRQAKKNQIPSMPVPEKTEGDILLGRVFQGDNMLDEFRLLPRDMNRHIGLFASTGHGKTVLIINLIKQIMEYSENNRETPINFLAFDFKQDYRHLTKQMPKIVCLRWNWLRLNPFVPPEGVSEPDWFNLVCSAFAHAFIFYQPSEYYLREFVVAEYEKVRESGYVHLEKVKQAIEDTMERRGRREDYQTVVLNRLTTTTQVLHDLLDCEQGIPISDLLQIPLVIELDMLEETIANFLIGLFLTYILVYRQTQRHRGGLRHLVIFDEAQKVFYKPSDFRSSDFATMGPSVIDDLPRVIRDFDEGLIFSTQEPSKINDSVLANTDLKLVGYLGNGIDITAVERMYHLDREDSDIIVKLTLGQWMAHKSGIPYPFLLKTPDYSLTKTLSDSELKEAMKTYIADMQNEPKKTGGTMLEYVTLPPLSQEAQKILSHVGQVPIRTIFNRYRELKIHPKDGSLAIKELQEKRFVNLHLVQLSPGRPAGYLEPTETGRMWLSKNNISLSAWDDYVGHVGLEHRVFQSNIAALLKKLGYSVKHEHPLNGKRFDLYAEFLVQSSGIKVDTSVEYKVEKNVGIEICVSPRTDFLAAQKVAGKLSEIIYVAKDQDVMMNMQKEYLSLGIDEPKFKFIIAHRYLTELRSQLGEKEGMAYAQA
jgi:hypothetical protein